MSVGFALLFAALVVAVYGLWLATFGNTATTASSVPGTMKVKKCRQEDIIAFNTPASTQINVGDLVVWNSAGNSGAGCIELMSDVVWDTDAATTQANALAVFLGVALGQKDAVDGTTYPIPVQCSGFAAFGCDALGAAKTVGAYVAPAAQGVHNLSDFLMAVVATQSISFGYLAQPALLGAVELFFWFQSPLIFGALPAP